MASDGPLVSVITTCLENPQLLVTQVVPSLMRQGHPHWELLVAVPEGSELGRVVEAIGDQRVRSVPFESKGGDDSYSPHRVRAEGLDAAMAVAGGQFIALVAGGDSFVPEHLEACVSALENGAALVHGPALGVDPNTGAERLLPADAVEVHESSVCFRVTNGEGFDTDGSAGAGAVLVRLVAARGGRIVALDGPQCVHRGDQAARIRVAMPSLPPFDSFTPLVETIFTTRHTSNGGPFARAFEAAIADYVGVPYVISAASGDGGLAMAFTALRELHPGSEVITPSYTFPSTANAAIRSGYRVRFCDVDPDTLCMRPGDVEALITAETAAIVPVHVHGHPCEMTELEAVASNRNIFLIGDAAGALGASYDGRRIGAFGHMEVFSFSSTKGFTTGEGGAVACSDPGLVDLVRSIGRYGLDDSYECFTPGINGRFPELPAALGVAAMPYVDEWLAGRARVAEQYLAGLEGAPLVKVARPRRGLTAWKDFPLVLASTETRDRLTSDLDGYGIETRPYYRPLHRMRAYQDLIDERTLPVSDRIADCMLCLPIHASLPERSVDLVIAATLESLEASRAAGIE